MRGLDSITDSIDVGLSKLWEIVKDKEARRAVVHGVAKGQAWLSDCAAIKFPPTVSFMIPTVFKF